MKRIGFFLSICVFLFLSLRGNAALTAFGTLSTVNNTTTNSVALQTNSQPVAVGTFVISNGGLASTNALAGIRQFSVDGTNWIGLGAAYTPSGTNAGSDTIAPQVITIPVYLRFSVTTTNSVQVGATYFP
jgi:hypothetical protein